ncbi:MAG: hypothetical protein Q4C47_06555 [Planctomycetia bacterium]|nr:hypothetical protein [Planctomycetia bacterium]
MDRTFRSSRFPRPPRSSRPRGSGALLRGLSLLLILSIVQRLVGFGRSVYFCHTLDDAALGVWELCYGFLVVASPLVVFSIPGTMGRYAPLFGQSGSLRAFLCRIATLCALTTFLASLTIFLTPTLWSRLILRASDECSGRLILWMAIALFLTNVMNFAWEMFTALKDLWATAMVQFGNSVAFLVAGVFFLRRDPTGNAVMIAYVLACVVTIMWSVWRTKRLWRTLPVDTESLGTMELLRRIGRTAFWLWCGVVMVLMFSYIDRLLPVWLITDPAIGVRVAGVCGCAGVVPQLLVSITTMFVAAMTPHFSEDWNRGNRRRLRRRLDFFLRTQTFLLCVAAVVMLWCVPWPLRPLFLDRYPGAVAIFPWITVSMILLAGIQIVQSWFLCAERLGFAVASLGVGLIFKTVLAMILVPRYGLNGVVTSMVVAHTATLLLLSGLAWYQGFRPGRMTLMVLVIPFSIGGGPVIATVVCGIGGVVLLPSLYRAVIRAAYR